MAITQDSISRNFSQEALRVLGQGAKGERGEKGEPGADEVAPVTTGYTSGGLAPPIVNTIDSFPFSTPFTTATDVGDISQGRYRVTGQSSSTDGYTTGGPTGTIDSFPFSTPFTTATDVGDVSRGYLADVSGQSSSTDGYASGGYTFSSTPRVSNVIENFPFSTPFTTATDVGDLSQARQRVMGQSSSSDGYTSGGGIFPPFAGFTTIDSFPFSSPFATATDAGNLSQGRYWATGQSSDSDGYTSGGRTPSTVATIDRFPFSTPFTTATDVGDLSQARRSAAGQSSDTDGYTSGGTPSQVNTIDSFPFSTPFTTATDAGDLSQARYGAAGQQG